MFTLQSGQIENALRMNGGSDISAKEMMQGFANCAAPLEHRGPVALTQPVVNLFPTVAPPIPAPGIRITGPQTKNVFIDIPPFVPYVPPIIPFPPGDEWQDIPYFDPGSFFVPGPSQFGPVTSDSVTTTQVTSTEISNSGDIVNSGDVVSQGDAVFAGDTKTENLAVTNNTTHNRTVVNNGDVINRGAVYNELAHNYKTVNHGPVHNHSATWMRGPVNMVGPVIIHRPPVVTGVPAAPFQVTLVTDVAWADNALTVKTRQATVFGVLGDETTVTLLEGTECPA